MKKNKGIRFLFLVIIIIMIFFLPGCLASNNIKKIAYSKLTPTTQYIHFSPSESSLIHLEFEYPENWIYNKEISNGFAGSAVIRFFDPRLQVQLTQFSDTLEKYPIEYGWASISVEPLRGDWTLEKLVDQYIQAQSGIWWISNLKDYQITIDGYSAQVVESQFEPYADNGYTNSMFKKMIYFQADNQIYQITLLVPIGEREGEFEQGFNYFLNSIRIVPLSK